jgi:hypothetical protein
MTTHIKYYNCNVKYTQIYWAIIYESSPLMKGMCRILNVIFQIYASS